MNFMKNREKSKYDLRFLCLKLTTKKKCMDTLKKSALPYLKSKICLQKLFENNVAGLYICTEMRPKSKRIVHRNPKLNKWWIKGKRNLPSVSFSCNSCGELARRMQLRLKQLIPSPVNLKVIENTHRC